MGSYEAVDELLVCPVMAGILKTLLNDYQLSKGRPKLGFVNPLLYNMALTKGLFIKPQTTNTHCTEYYCCDSEFG